MLPLASIEKQLSLSLAKPGVSEMQLKSVFEERAFVGRGCVLLEWSSGLSDGNVVTSETVKTFNPVAEQVKTFPLILVFLVFNSYFLVLLQPARSNYYYHP